MQSATLSTLRQWRACARGPSVFRAAVPDERRAMATAAVTYQVANTAAEVQALLAQGYKYVDVRNPDEFKAGHVPGAVNIPLGPTLPAAFKAHFPTEAEKLVVACQAGRRCATALEALSSSGAQYTNAVNFSGSFNAWIAEGMPVEK